MIPPTPLRNVALDAFNTLALPGRAAHYLPVDTLACLHDLPSNPHRFVLGGGSNLVLRGDIDGLLLHIRLRGKELRGEDTDAWYIEAAAGESWHDFVLWTLAQGWPGLENLVLIPGTVGAAPVQNIGAYGLEAGELIHTVRAIDLKSGQEKTFSQSDCRFDYRNSLWKQEGWHLDPCYLIVAVLFRLPKHWQPRLRYAELARMLEQRSLPHPTPLQIAEMIAFLRQQKLPDPAKLANAGSFFENPLVDAATAAHLKTIHPSLPCYPQTNGRVKLAAGWLIEHAGWKGRRLGPVGMYDKQALVLVNHGKATGRDVERLVAAVQADVEHLFGIRLVPEPVFVGRPTACTPI